MPGQTINRHLWRYQILRLHSMKNLTRQYLLPFAPSWVFSVSAQTGSPIALGQWRSTFLTTVRSVWQIHRIKFIVQVFMVCTVIPNPPVSSICIRVWTDFQILKSLKSATIRKEDPFIAYQSSNIDLILSDNSIVNLSDIKRKEYCRWKKSMTLRFSETKRISVVSSESWWWIWNGWRSKTHITLE